MVQMTKSVVSIILILFLLFGENSYASVICKILPAVQHIQEVEDVLALERKLSLDQYSSLKYPRDFYQRAKNNLDFLLIKSVTTRGFRKDLELRRVQAKHGEYFYRRKLAEVMGENPSEINRLQSLEDHFFRRTNNVQTFLNIESEIKDMEMAYSVIEKSQSESFNRLKILVV